MALWLAGLLAFLGASAFIVVLVVRRKVKRRWLLAVAIAAALLFLAALTYNLLTFIFLGAM
jgi:hypothetical protein